MYGIINDTQLYSQAFHTLKKDVIEFTRTNL